MKAGDHVLVNGQRAELLTEPGAATDAVVRRLQWADDIGWWGHHYSHVPWHTITPTEKENTP